MVRVIKKRILFTLMGLVILLGCEKDITFEPLQQEPKLVVDAEIENGRPPIVVLSNSLNYFSTIDTAALFNSFVKNAVVNIFDGTKKHTLRYFEFRSSNGIRYAFYTNDPADPSGVLLGAEGKTYRLTIETGGKLYNSTTTIPNITKKVDSLWWKPVPNRPVNDSFRVLMARITDPPGLGNYIRYFTKVNSEDFLPGFNSVYDDVVIDGKTYNTDVDKGVDKNRILERENFGFFKSGDTVTVRLSNIDKASFDFWRTWEFTFQSIGNPFSAPGVVTGNINNGALGAFCGYGSQYRRIIIPK
ncbi:MAG: DUF4249 domain-containing protein [Sphingobacteriia bacterium]|nr:MAG: DUF4249 domain-containing protein [Sphingobacteriia bacterium]